MEAQLPIAGGSLPLNLAILLVSVLGVSFFSGSEASLLSVNKVRIRSLAERGNRAATAALRVWNQHDKLFATILFTENMLIIFATSMGTAIALAIAGPQGVYASTLVMTLVVVIFGEITPKTFAARHADRISLVVSRPIEAIIKLERPIIWALTAVTNFFLRLLRTQHMDKSPFVTEEELVMQITIAEREGLVSETERKLLHNVFEFCDMNAGSVMIPRTEITGVPHTASLRDFLATFAQTRHSLYPVYRDNLDDIVGIIGIKNVLRAMAQDHANLETPITPLVRPALFVPETKRVGDLLNDMAARHAALAIVIDEYGGTAGLVTFEMLTEEIVGEFREDVAQEEPSVQRLSDQQWSIDAQMRVDEANEALGMDLPTGDYETLAGLILNKLGHVPNEGEELSLDGARIKVTRMVGVKIDRALVTVENQVGGDADERGWTH